MTRVTESNVFSIKDSITGTYNYQAQSETTNDSILNGRKQFGFRIDYHPESSQTYFVATSYSELIFRGVLFSNKIDRVNIEINNSTRVDSAISPNVSLTRQEVMTLHKILSSPEPIIARVYTNKGYYDIEPNKIFNAGIKDILKMSIDNKK